MKNIKYWFGIFSIILGLALSPALSYGKGSSSSRSFSSSSSHSSFSSGSSSSHSSFGFSSAKSSSPSTSSRSFGFSSSKSSYDSGAAHNASIDASKTAYKAFSSSSPTFSSKTTNSKNYGYSYSSKPDPIQQQRDYLSNHYTIAYYNSRPLRMRSFFSGYSPYTAYIYNDNYNSLFWSWLLVQSLDTQSMWLYNHQQTMDQMRYNSLISQNAILASKVQALQASGQAVNPNYTPNGIDNDLMYNDVPAPTPSPAVVTPNYSGFGSFMKDCFYLLMGTLGLIGVIYLVFSKKWN